MHVCSSKTDLLLVLLVNSIDSVLDGDAFQVACCNFQSQWKGKVDLLDQWLAQGLLEGFLVIDGGRGGIDLPVRQSICVPSESWSRVATYQFSFCVSGWILISTPSFSVDDM